MRYWLMKTEPSVCSFEDIISSPDHTTAWEGVRNYQARNLMRDQFTVSDRVLIYHSNAEPTAIMGLASVVRSGYSDPTALDPKSRYFDERASKNGFSPWVMVDVRAISRFKVPVSREELHRHIELGKMMVLKRGARLSVQPVTESEYEFVCGLGHPVAI